MLFIYALLRLKQSIHFRLLVSLGVKGRELIAPPQVAHCQLPENLGFPPDEAEPSGKASLSSGLEARSASKGMSGASDATDMLGAGFDEPPLFLL